MRAALPLVPIDAFIRIRICCQSHFLSPIQSLSLSHWSVAPTVFRHASHWRFEFHVIDRRFSFESASLSLNSEFTLCLCYLILFPTPSSALNASRKMSKLSNAKKQNVNAIELWGERERERERHGTESWKRDAGPGWRWKLDLDISPLGHMSPLAQFQSKLWPQATWQSELLLLQLEL